MSTNQQEFTFKITVVGDPAVGKTTLVRKYTTGAFEKDYIATLGAQFSKYDEKIEGNQVNLIIWDIAGQELYETMRRKFYNGTSGAIIVFSLGPDEPKSLVRVEKWFNELKQHCGNVPIALFGNKIDLVNETILASNNAKVSKYLEEPEFIGYYQTSALTGQGVTEAFQKLVRELYFHISD